MKPEDFTLDELTLIATALLKAIDAPGEWYFINPTIAKEVLRKIEATCRPVVNPKE